MTHFTHYIYQWYDQNQRALPWRSTRDPYLIWVSETILQQTRISQGLPYYHRFVGRFPDIHSLAAAPEDELMKMWEGLGYYSRARNMHAAARMVVNEMGGIFPQEYENLRRLKGVGNYTAAAVASIAFGKPYPVIDGNITRLFSRYFGILEPADTPKGKNTLAGKTREAMNHSDPGYHNQALMEFGALCCVPKNPSCHDCLLKDSCFAFLNGMTGLMKMKNKKIAHRIRRFYFYLLENKENIIIEKRENADIWRNLYQLPLLEADEDLADAAILSNYLTRELLAGEKPAVQKISNTLRHELTHQIIRAKFVRFKMPKLKASGNRIIINKKEIHKFAFPVLVRNYLAGTVDK